MTTEPDLFEYAAQAAGEQPLEPAGEILLAYLRLHTEWRTRREICADLAWSERQLRDAAEQLGAGIIRGQLGFKLVEHLTREDFPVAQQAFQAFISQGKRMIRYGLAGLKHLHTKLG